jgi:hypothetical protein
MQLRTWIRRQAAAQRARGAADARADLPAQAYAAPGHVADAGA